MKKITLLALAAVSALLALPAFASANPPVHISAAPETFSVTGGPSKLERTSGGGTHGSSVSGTGNFENTTTGTVELIFHGVTSDFGTCTQTGGPLGTVKTTKLPFHLVTLAGAQPGILITSLNNHFATFHCGFASVVVTGNGILGTITAPACGGTSNKATLSFKPSIPGHQQHKTITNVNYGLTSNIFGSVSPSSMDATATVTFPKNQTLVCT